MAENAFAILVRSSTLRRCHSGAAIPEECKNMTDTTSFIVLAHILGCAGLASVTSLISFRVVSHLDKSHRSAGDKFVEDYAMLMFPCIMAVVAMIAVAFAIDSGTAAIACVYIGSALIGPVFLAGVAALQWLCQVICQQVETFVDGRAAKTASARL
jgi:hypothetical protein